MSDDRLPVLSRDAVREVDRHAIEQIGIPGVVLMENAARGLHDVARAMVGDTPTHWAIVCGSGNNGGDGYALARHLHIDGDRVTLVAPTPPREGSDAAINERICHRLGLPVVTQPVELIIPPDVIVDAVFGTGLTREVTGAAADLIEWINAQALPVLAVDVPSGLDAETGETLGAVVQATRTVTFVAAKPGMVTTAGRAACGEITVAGIGAPT